MTNSDDLICIVDDDKLVLRALKRLLFSKGLPSKPFCSPLEFIEYAKSHPIRVVILDINMPEMSGLEVFAWLRAASPGSQVIFLSGNEDTSCRSTVIAQGAVAYFTKPSIDDTFVDGVQGALSRFPLN